MDDDIHISSLRQLDHKLSNALAESSLLTVKANNNNNLNSSSLMNSASGRISVNRPSFSGATNTGSYHQNLNQMSSLSGDNYLMETRAFPYSNSNNNNINNLRTNSTCKIYQDVDEFKGHLV